MEEAYISSFLQKRSKGRGSLLLGAGRAVSVHQQVPHNHHRADHASMQREALFIAEKELYLSFLQKWSKGMGSLIQVRIFNFTTTLPPPPPSKERGTSLLMGELIF
jgi:hypothetical protein